MEQTERNLKSLLCQILNTVLFFLSVCLMNRVRPDPSSTPPVMSCLFQLDVIQGCIFIINEEKQKIDIITVYSFYVSCFNHSSISLLLSIPPFIQQFEQIIQLKVLIIYAILQSFHKPFSNRRSIPLGTDTSAAKLSHSKILQITLISNCTQSWSCLPCWVATSQSKHQHKISSLVTFAF